MATRKRAPKNAPAPDGHADPRTPLDVPAFMAALAPVVRLLEDDLLARARKSPAVLRGLEERWQAEKAAHRTADPFDVWQRAFVEQLAAAWALSCVFVRTLEDRGLLAQNRLAGPGALDSQKAFFDLVPSLSERDYLLATLRELSHLPAARDLFDARHNPVWVLGPSADAAKALLALFRTPDAAAPTFRFGGSDTRFLGDLYQDLSEDVRKRYALLQTPRFVETYILDRTLDRAVQRFGLEQVSLLDPTCGSGHFLLGAFDRLFHAFLRAEPGLDPRQAAQKALDRIAGADVNPYAVAIARFRLVLAFLDAGKYAKLAGADEPRIHLAVADSLLHGKEQKQRGFADLEGQSRREWEGGLYSLEDPAAARDVLDKRYAAVVGNPPYITVKDAAVREEIRKSYPKSAFRSYSLAAPFGERFFQLAKPGGCVGMITANSFMKREFGKKLIEEVFPTLNLDGIVNTSGAYIPGHGTPTVILFGTNEKPQSPDVLSVLAKRGEPSTPDDPEQGLVWRSIEDHGDEVGFENEYVSVARVSRETLNKHPWSLGGGGAAELKELLEERVEKTLGDFVEAIGRTTHTGDDEFFFMPAGAADRLGVPPNRRVPLITGEQVRDWSIAEQDISLFPYDLETAEPRVPESKREQALYWSCRAWLRNRQDFGQKIEARGLQWFEHSMFFPARYLRPLGIAFAFVATHNHFVLDRGGKVFNRSAPVIKLPPDATEDDHLALLAYLNSSTACFWMKQAMHDKGNRGEGGGITAESWERFYEFTGTGMAALPVPPLDAQHRSRLVETARALNDLATERRRTNDLSEALGDVATAADIEALVAKSRYEGSALEGRIRGMQERLDWLVYRAFGLADDSQIPTREHLELTERESDRRFASRVRAGDVGRRYFELCRLPPPEDFPAPSVRQLSAELDFIETPEFKRTFREGFRPPDLRGQIVARALSECERALAVISSSRAIADQLSSSARAALDWLSDASLTDLMKQESVPFLAAYRYTDSGLEKRAAWEKTWELQRREDAGEDVGDIPIPPKYAQGDFREAHYWRLRGKLDVPKERFISYPGCESDEDGEPLYGWAGWDHKQQALALMTLYQQRKTLDAWPKERLIPMLAGLRELLPWLHQWHAEPDPDFGMSMAEYFAHLLETERAVLGVTERELADWRPAAKGRGRKRGGS